MQLLLLQRAACWLSWWRMARRLNPLTMQVNALMTLVSLL
jgi:hypothetical protein